MSDCLLTGGLSAGCGDYNQGGIESTILIANKSEIGAVTYDGTGKVTGITMDLGKTFYEFIAEEGTAFYTEDHTRGNAVNMYAPTVTFAIGKKDQEALNILRKVDFADVVIIITDNSGIARIFGNGDSYKPGKSMKKMSGSLGSGTAMTDASGVIFNFTGGGPAPAPEVDTTILANLV